jgi:pimeloyl-ACP methyl ester carboxylesterase
MAGTHGPVTDGVVDEPAPTPQTTSRRHPRSWARRAFRLVVTVAVVLVVVFTAAAWYLSGRVGSSGLHVSPIDPSSRVLEPNVVVTGVGRRWVQLEPTGSLSEDLASSNVYGLDWTTGFGWLRALRGTAGDRATRSFVVLSGRAPSVGTAARVVRDAYPLDPGSLLGFTLRGIQYRSPAGTFPAYLAAGRGDTWAILVHGRGATRAEIFRLMRLTVGLRLPSLAIAYRHDPETGGGRAMFGQTEWADLDAAARWAIRHGARHLVLAGTSMGGAITAAFLERSTLADRVIAVVLDAPALDFPAMIEYNAQQQSLPVLGLPVPSVLTKATLRLAAWRYGLDLSRVDYLDNTSWVTVPVLAFHGAADPKTPRSILEQLAAAAPGRVVTVEVPGAGHVESWNVDPRSYEQEVLAFLRPLTASARR